MKLQAERENSVLSVFYFDDDSKVPPSPLEPDPSADGDYDDAKTPVIPFDEVSVHMYASNRCTNELQKKDTNDIYRCRKPLSLPNSLSMSLLPHCCRVWTPMPFPPSSIPFLRKVW